jgi:predicted aconitase with swiveling domain
MAGMITLTGRKIVRGCAAGPLVLIPTSFSFLGDVDMNTSQVIAPMFKDQNLFLKNSILLFTETKGSSGGCVVLITLARKNIAPLGIITIKLPDYNLTEGSILAGIPFISEIDSQIITLAKSGDWTTMDANKGQVILKH